MTKAEYMRQWRATHVGYNSRYSRRWQRANPAAQHEMMAAWRRRTGGGAAHSAVQAAVKRGDLVRPDSCSRCGAAGRIEASHDDYDRPLDVEWLCRRCHADKDLRIKE